MTATSHWKLPVFSIQVNVAPQWALFSPGSVFELRLSFSFAQFGQQLGQGGHHIPGASPFLCCLDQTLR